LEAAFRPGGLDAVFFQCCQASVSALTPACGSLSPRNRQEAEPIRAIFILRCLVDPGENKQEVKAMKLSTAIGDRGRALGADHGPRRGDAVRDVLAEAFDGVGHPDHVMVGRALGHLWHLRLDLLA
jgi:hypothetical protein